MARSQLVHTSSPKMRTGRAHGPKEPGTQNARSPDKGHHADAIKLQQVVRRSRLGVKAHVANGVLKVRSVVAGDGVHGATANYGAHLARLKVHACADRPRANLALEMQRSIRLEDAPETRHVRLPSPQTRLVNSQASARQTAAWTPYASLVDRGRPDANDLGQSRRQD